MSLQKKQLKYSKLQGELSDDGVKKKKLDLLKQKVDIEDMTLLPSSDQNIDPQLKKKEYKKISATVEYLQDHKKKIWKDKLSSLEIDTLTTKLSKILDQELTSKGKDLKPWWTKESKEISKKLWLPIKIDCVDSVLTSSKESFKPIPMGKSWFSIKNKHPLKKNSLQTCFQLSQFSLPDSMDSEVILSKDKLKKKPLKTLKMRLFPTNEEKKKINIMAEQFRWYYNANLNIVYNHYGYKEIGKNKLFTSKIRDIVRKYDFVEEKHGNLIFQEFKYNSDRNKNPSAPWWTEEPHNRVSRGATNKFVSSLNSAISNKKNKNIKRFKMNYITKKSNTEFLSFEDKSFPSIFKNIKSRYWYTTRDRKRKNISFKELQCNNKGIEVIHDKIRNRYFLHYPVDYDWFPSDDKRNDSQVMFSEKEDRIISLDPGIRKFMVGYDPKGKCIFVGEGENNIIMDKLHSIDMLSSLLENEDDSKERERLKKEKHLIWIKVRNMISELHWKTIKFLISNYDIILLPEFRTSHMLKRGNLHSKTKRMMCMYSFYRFKELLKWKCALHGKKVIIVDESWTSKTCGVCGVINNTQGKEILRCDCGVEIDRDASGSRNILIKNLSYARDNV